MQEIEVIRNNDDRLVAKRYLLDSNNEQMIGIVAKGCFTGVIIPAEINVKIVNMSHSDMRMEGENGYKTHRVCSGL